MPPFSARIDEEGVLDRQLQAGRGRLAARGGHARAARRRVSSLAQPGAKSRRSARADRRQCQGQRGAQGAGRRSTAPALCGRTCSTCRITPKSRCAASSHRSRTAQFILPLDNGARIQVARTRRCRGAQRLHRFHAAPARSCVTISTRRAPSRPPPCCMCFARWSMMTFRLNAGCLKPLAN